MTSIIEVRKIEHSMTFQELISHYKWQDIRDSLLLLYPEEKKSILGYEKAFAELLDTLPTISDDIIHIETVKDVDGESYESVYAAQDDDTTHYGLDFTSWAQVLASQIADDVFNSYSGLEIICHILFEITFCGYSSAEVEAEGAKLSATIDEIKESASMHTAHSQESG